MVKVDAKLSYQENCDYLPSSVYGEIEIEPKEIDIETKLTIIDYNLRDTEIGDRGRVNFSKYINGEYDSYNNMQESINFRPFYNDILLFETFTYFTYENTQYPVKYKDLDIYFFEENEDRTQLDPNDSDHAIAVNFEIDENGKTGIRYLPHNSGYFVVHYHATTYFKEKIVEHKVNLEQIPVKVYIKPVEARANQSTKDLLPLFISMEQAADLAASVRDIYGQRPKDGVITFLSYYVHDINNPRDGEERVIGNPIMLENGETLLYEPKGILLNDNKESEQEHQYEIPPMGNVTEGPDPTQDDWQHLVYEDHSYSGFISYSPIQYLYNDVEWDGYHGEQGYNTDEQKYQSGTEIICAVYNYENKRYGDSWKYYTQSKAWGHISALIPGQLNIAIRKGNESINDLPQIREDGLYPYSSNDTMVVYIVPTDKNGNVIDLSIDNKYEFYNITLKIIGTQTTTHSDTFEYDKYTYITIKNPRDNELTYQNGMFKFTIPMNKINAYNENGEYINGRKFIEGIYTIEAAMDIINDNETESTEYGYDNDDNNDRFNLYNMYHGVNPQKKDDRYYDHMESVQAYFDLIIEEPFDYNTNINENGEDPETNEFNYHVDCYYKEDDYGDLVIKVWAKNNMDINLFAGKKMYLNIDNDITLQSNMQIVDNKIEAHYKMQSQSSDNNIISLQNLRTGNHTFTATIKASEVSELDDDFVTGTESFIICMEEIPHITKIDYLQKNYKGHVRIYITVDNVYTNTNVITEIRKASNNALIKTFTNTVNKNDYTFDLELTELNAGDYTVKTTCVKSQRFDEGVFDIDKANLWEIINTSSCITGGNQTITIGLGCDGDIDSIQELLCHIGKKITYNVPLRSLNDVIKIQARDFNLVQVQNNELSLDAYHQQDIRFWDGCAAIAHGWQHGTEWEASFYVYSGNRAIGSSGAVFISDVIPNYVYPAFASSGGEKNPYQNPDWVAANCIEINSNGKIYLHNAGDADKREVTAYHQENLYGGILAPHYFNDGMRVVLRYGTRLFTCQECGYEVNRAFDTCPMCGNNDITYERGNFYTILQETGAQSDYFNFTFDGFIFSSNLHLIGWNYGGITHGNHIILKNISFIHEEYLDNQTVQLLGDNTALISGRDDIVDEGEYQYRAVYDGDENYNDLRPFTYDIKIRGTSQNGTLTRIDNNTFKIHHKNYNTQHVIGWLLARNLNDEIRIPIITKINGTFTIEDIDNWDSYTEFELHKNPKDEDLLEIMQESNTNDVYENLIYYYENLTFRRGLYPPDYHYEPAQFNKSLAISLHNQWLENEEKVLFTTYNYITIR